jgi:hypothetical protein
MLIAAVLVYAREEVSGEIAWLMEWHELAVPTLRLDLPGAESSRALAILASRPNPYSMSQSYVELRSVLSNIWREAARSDIETCQMSRSARGGCDSLATCLSSFANATTTMCRTWLWVHPD